MKLSDKLAINSSRHTCSNNRLIVEQFKSHELNLNANNNTIDIDKQIDLVDNLHKTSGKLLIESRSTSLDEHEHEEETLCRQSKNLSDMSRIDIHTILSELNSKFFSHKYYTEASTNTLIALNPFRDIGELYSQQMMNFYNNSINNNRANNACAAHIYKHAAHAWRMIKHAHTNQSNQTVLVSGDSGSGKTRSINFIIQYYSHITSATRKSIQIKDILLKTNLILESFGNAKTALNDNSSRFGKYIKLYFCANSCQLVSAKLITYLLEKTRSVNCSLHECFNFHVFYQLLFGSDETERSKYFLDQSLLNKHSMYDDNPATAAAAAASRMLFKNKLNQLKSSFRLIDLNEEKIFSVISAIAHLNCCLFSSELAMSHETKQHLHKAARLLRFDLTDLTNYLLVHELRITNSHTDLIKIPCNLNQIKMRKNSLIKLVYNELFKHLVKAINSRLEFDTDTVTVTVTDKHKCIGLLDIYGFESVDTANSLEQLCINYANEKLQKIFIDSYFKLNKLEYESEFPCEDFAIEYNDNLPLLKLIESPSNSLFCLLNEQSVLKSHDHMIDEQQLLFKIRQTFAAHTDLIYEPRPNCRSQFFIRHYAGRVGYNTDSLVSKNADHVPDDLLKFVTKSFFLSDIVADHVDKLSRPRHKKSTVLAKFKKNLDNLISNLNKTNILYVRCIKPNCELKPDHFDHELVHNQLESCGIISLLNLSKQGFIHKYSYKSFAHRFVSLAAFIKRDRCAAEIKNMLALAKYKQACVRVLELSHANKQDYRLGWSKIFLKDKLFRALDSLLEQTSSAAAALIQCAWRRYKLRLLNASATIIQNWWRTMMTTSRQSSSIQIDSVSIQSSNYLIELDIVEEKLNMKKE